MITKEMLIFDALQKAPGCQEVFLEFGMHCLGCAMAKSETIEQAAAAHGVDAEVLLKKLNDFAAKQ